VRTNDASGPGIDIAGLVNFGRPYDGNGRRTETHRQVSYAYARSIGHHLWKAGATVNRVHLNASMADGFGGTYIFASLAHFAAGRPDSFRQAFGSIQTAYPVTSTGAFLQDHWSITQRLTVDLGMRYDFEHLPQPFRQDANNVSPRLGLAYQFAPGWVNARRLRSFLRSLRPGEPEPRSSEKRRQRVRTSAGRRYGGDGFPGHQWRDTAGSDCGLDSVDLPAGCRAGDAIQPSG